MKLNRQIRIIITSTDVNKIDLEIKKLKLLLENKTLTKVTVFVKKKKQRFYTVLKSPQKYKRAKNTYRSYIYEGMLIVNTNLDSNLNLLFLSQLKDFCIQNRNLGFQITTKVVKIAEKYKSTHLFAKLRNRYLFKKVLVAPKETPREHIKTFVKKIIKYVKPFGRKKLKISVVKACIHDHLKEKKQQKLQAKMLLIKKIPKKTIKKSAKNKKNVQKNEIQSVKVNKK